MAYVQRVLKGSNPLYILFKYIDSVTTIIIIIITISTATTLAIIIIIIIIKYITNYSPHETQTPLEIIILP